MDSIQKLAVFANALKNHQTFCAQVCLILTPPRFPYPAKAASNPSLDLALVTNDGFASFECHFHWTTLPETVTTAPSSGRMFKRQK